MNMFILYLQNNGINYVIGKLEICHIFVKINYVLVTFNKSYQQRPSKNDTLRLQKKQLAARQG